MGINVGQVTGQRIGNYKGLTNVRLLQVNLLGDSADTVLFFNVSGEDTAPVNGDMVCVLDNGSFRIAFAIWDLLAAAATAGEKRLYSRDSGGAEQATVVLKPDGQLELNGTGDFAVRYTQLNMILQQLVTDINTALASKLNGSGSAGTITLDLTASKIDEIEVPA